MGAAVVGAVGAIVGAVLGSITALWASHRQSKSHDATARAQAERDALTEMRQLAMALALKEAERHPESAHSVAAYYKVMEGILQQYWPTLDLRDPASKEAVDSISGLVHGKCTFCDTYPRAQASVTEPTQASRSGAASDPVGIALPDSSG